MTPRAPASFKLVDRTVGIPLVWAAGAARRLRRPRRPPATLRRIGLLKTNAIGDTILAGGVIQDLRRALPDAHLSLFTGHSNAGIGRLLDGPDEVVELRIARVHEAVAALRARHLDVILDLGTWPRINGLLTACSGAGYALGFRTRGQHRHGAYDRWIRHDDTAHEIESYRRLLHEIQIPTGAWPRIALPADVTVPHIPRPYAVCHGWASGSGKQVKQWPAERWTAVAAGLRDLGLQVVFTGGPADRHDTSSVVRDCRDHGLDGIHRLAGELTLAQTAALLGDAALAVSVNTGIMHLAAAMGAPLVSLNGPVPVIRWGALSRQHTPLTPAIEGCGYINLGMEYPRDPPPCMESITVDAVLSACARRLGVPA
jgi:lipopolysaccharide heptosyltransferase III